MRIGLLGGTFDPIHLGHLILAERVREAASLDAVWFLPSFQPPHKNDVVISDFDLRRTMTELAVAGNAAFRVEAIERTLPPPSYTVQTLAALKAAHPRDEFSLIVGADCLPDLPKWYEPRRILEQAALLAVPRPGVEAWDAARLAKALAIPPSSVRLRMIDCPLIDIASRDLRARVAAGQSIRYLVPAAVEEFIRTHHLYRPAA